MSNHVKAANSELIGLAVRLKKSDVVTVTPVPRADTEESHAFEVQMVTLIDSTGHDATDLSRASDIKVQMTEKDVTEARLPIILDRMCGSGVLPVFRLLRVTPKNEGEPLQYQWRDRTSSETSAKFMLAN